MENNLLININDNFTLDSREVAEMIDKPHYDLMKTIRNYIKYLGEGEIPFTDYFIESTYISDQNKELPRYEITKMGCQMVANKLTGKNGVIFTAKYVKRFNDMENYIKNQERAQLQAAITKFEMLTQEVRQYFKPLHRTKLEYNRLIKSLTSNNQEANLVKRWVFMKMGIRTWEDTCLDDSSRIKELIQSTSKLVQIDNFEQISLLQ